MLRPRNAPKIRERNFHLIENPLTDAIRKTWALITDLEFTPKTAVPSAITGCVLLLVLVILAVLWLYGWIPVIAHFLWQFVIVAKKDILLSNGFVRAMPHTVALGIYIVIWAPFAFLCLPMLLIGFLGKVIAVETSKIE